MSDARKPRSERDREGNALRVARGRASRRVQAMDMLDEFESDPGSSCLRLVRTLLWTQIAARVPEAERDTVRRVVGEAHWAPNEALFAEAEALESILGELEEARERRERSFAILQHPGKALLEDRVMGLVADIRLAMAATAKVCGDEQASKLEAKFLPLSRGRVRLSRRIVWTPPRHLHYDHGHNHPCLFSSRASVFRLAMPQNMILGELIISVPSTFLHAQQDKQVLDHVARNAHSRSRPCTPCTPSSSRGGSRMGSRAPSSLSSASPEPGGGTRAEDGVQVDCFAPNLDAFRIDEVAESIRDALREEKNLIDVDIRMMHEALYEEAGHQAADSVAPPRVDELQELSERLEGCRDEAVAHAEHAERVMRIAMPGKAARKGKVGQLRMTVEGCRGIR